MSRHLITVEEAEKLRAESPRWAATRIKTCERCGRLFIPDFQASRTKYCSEECAVTVKADRRRHPEAQKVARRGGRWMVSHECRHCGHRFWSKRHDAQYCSGKCRVAAHRSR